MSSAVPESGSGQLEPEMDPRRWRALAVLGLVQFMLIIDVTVVNVALPQIQRQLDFTGPGLAWVVDGYVIMAGGLLLLGGRLADVFGRRRVFMAGVAVFAVASVVCGAAITPEMLVIGRFVQGVGEAFAAPAALGLIVLLFTDPKERVKALGIWGGLAGLGGVTGTVISGALTDLASWRWIFLINVPVAIAVLLVVPRLVSESRMVRENRQLDFTGALTATGGLVASVYGLLQAATHSWGSWRVLVPLIGGLLLVGMMVVVEARSASPLIPMRFFTHRTRVVANVLTLFMTPAFFAYFFLMTLFEQQVLRYSPLRTGLYYLPFGIGIVVGIGIGTALMPRLGVKPPLLAGFFGSALGLVWTSGIGVDSTYLGGILPGMVVFAVFIGMTMPTIINAALHGITGQDSSLASGVQNAVYQVGGAVGLALLVTLALGAARDDVAAGVPSGVAAAGGYALAFQIGAVLLAVGGVLTLLLMENFKEEAVTPGAEVAPEEATQKTVRS